LYPPCMTRMKSAPSSKNCPSSSRPSLATVSITHLAIDWLIDWLIDFRPGLE
jgi:hypothetical protein